MDEPYNPFEDPNSIPSYIIIPLFLFLVTPSTLFFFLVIKRVTTRPSLQRSATVLVLGDIGRSPRMMHHADSLAKHGWQTFMVGHKDTAPIPSLLGNPKVQLLGLAEGPRFVGSLPWVMRAPIRVVFQMVSVINLCIWAIPCNTEILLVQNPPSIPTLALAQFVCLLTKTKLIIDWHNTGYSILSMRVGEKSVLVRIATWFESTFGRSAYAHLFVTKALEEYLVKEWDLKGRTTVLYDRPPPNFRRTDPLSQHELFTRLIDNLDTPIAPETFPHDSSSTIFTEISETSGTPVLSADRPAFVISSTSWTADEDFSLLITALDKYQAARDDGAPLPKLVVLITGKGALRAPFEKTVASRETGQWKDIIVRCVFMPAQEYPTLLGCADLGVSLHSSSSGKDLPMKVVDMFGCGVPVLARKFACIDELVQDGRNGLVFDTGEEMGAQLITLLSSFPSSEKLSQLQSFFEAAREPQRRGVASGQSEGDEWSTWDHNWDRVFYQPILARIKG